MSSSCGLQPCRAPASSFTASGELESGRQPHPARYTVIFQASKPPSLQASKLPAQANPVPCHDKRAARVQQLLNMSI